MVQGYRGVYSGGNMTSYPDGYYTIKLDGFGTATFYKNPLMTGNYAYVFDAQGYCVATFTDGELAGKEMYIRLSSVTISGKLNTVFIIRKYLSKNQTTQTNSWSFVHFSYPPIFKNIYIN